MPPARSVPPAARGDVAAPLPPLAGGRRARARARPAARPGRWSATCPSSCTTAATGAADLGRGVRRPRARRAGRGGPSPTVYGRRAGAGCSTGCSSPPRPGPRASLRTGPPRGRLGGGPVRVRDGALVRGVYSQHRGRGALPGGRDPDAPRGRPLVFLANGSHAAYFVPGVRDRMWPDPNDEADGRARACGRGSCASPRTRRRGCPTAGRGAARARAGSPARRTRRAGPRSSPATAGATRPRGRRSARSVHARGLQRARRVRPGRDRARRRPGAARRAARAGLRLAPLAPGDRAGGRRRPPAAAVASGLARERARRLRRARWPLRCQGLRIRGPSSVTATVNSKCAASEPSWE